MTIKKRLFWSNILMIAVPVVSTILIGCVCMGLIWLSLIGGMGLGINDQEDFDHACMAVSEMLEYDIGRDAGFSSVKALLWFLTKFVFKRIEEPLYILAGGVHEIRDGNLDYRITYVQEDEFRPVCEDFNEMAVRLKESVDRMQAQEKSRRELIAGISHDLRSPLTSIQAYVEGLLDGVARTPESQKRYLETIKQKAEDLAHIISHLFLLSKMELGEYPENPQRLSLDEKISETVSALQEEYERQGLEIHTTLIPANINADPVYLHRILMNILENSLKYKKEGKANLWICLEEMPDGYRLSFTDDGPGVDQAALPHLFEVFYRNDPSRQNPGKGSGVGLAIVANAVQRMDGHIQALANEPQGLIIRIDFPKERSDCNGENTTHRG